MTKKFVSYKGEDGFPEDVTFATIDELRNDTRPQIELGRVYVRNYAIPKDGGGGFFTWEDNEDADNDDGIFILPTGHVGDGRWVREGYLADEYHAFWWGMGSAEDTDASSFFQKAIDASAAAGRPLRVPRNHLSPYPGTRYKLENIIPRTNMHIKADPDVVFFANFSGGSYQPCWVVDLDDPPFDFSIEGGRWSRFKPFFKQDQPVSLPAMRHGTFSHMLVQGANNGENGFEFTLYVDMYFYKVTFSRLHYGVWLKGIRPYTEDLSSTATGGTTTTLIDTALTGTVNDQYNGSHIVLRPFTATTEVRSITDYVAGTQTFTVSPAFSIGPSASDAYLVYNERYEIVATIDSVASTTTIIALKDVDLTDDEHNGKKLFIQDTSSVSYLKDITDTDGTAETVTITTALGAAPSVGSFALLVPSAGYSGHHNITNFDQCRWIGMYNYGIYKLDNDRDAAVLRVHNSSAEGGTKGWMKVGGNMENLVVEGMYIEYNGAITDEPDIIIDASKSHTIRGCTLRDLYFSVQGSNQTEKLHIIGRVNPTISDCTFNLAISGSPTVAIYLDLWQVLHRQTGAYLRNNLILDSYTPGETYRDRLYRLAPGMNEAAIVVDECGFSNQDLMPGLELALGTVTSNDVDVTLFKSCTADYGSAETIDTLSGGVLAQTLYIRFTTSNTTLTHNAAGVGRILLNGKVDLTPDAGSLIVLYYDGANWLEIGYHSA